jgi:hypothetical protein
MTMKAINVLRGFLSESPSAVYPDEVLGYVDAIERELEKEYVTLPKDADGVPIHIGDRVENNERVVRIVLTDESWEPSVYVEKLPNVLHEHFCHEISHYHAPTVEDVLRRFLGECESASALGYTDMPQDIFDTYAAKLRLAGEAE